MIADAIKQAQRIHRQVLEAAYDGNLTVLEYQQVKNPKTKLTEQKEVVVLEKQPCRLSHDSVQPSAKERGAEEVFQMVRLFLAPEVKIKPGSKLSVTQNGVTRAYQCSGTPAVYATHQEIILTLFERWT